MMKILLGTFAIASLMAAGAAHACPEKLPQSVTCKRLTTVIDAPKLVAEEVEILYWLSYTCPSCGIIAGVLPAWRGTLPGNAGLAQRHMAAWAGSRAEPYLMPNDSTLLFEAQRTYLALSHVLPALGVGNDAPIYAISLARNNRLQIVPRVAAAFGLSEQAVRAAAEQSSVRESFAQSVRLNQQIKFEQAPVFVVDRKFLVEFVEPAERFWAPPNPAGSPAAPDPLRAALDEFLTVTRDIASSVAGASAGGRHLVGIFSDWESPVMDDRRRSCEAEARNRAGTVQRVGELFGTQERLGECLMAGAPAALAAAAELECREALGHLEHSPGLALRSARLCLGYVLHGWNNLDHLRRASDDGALRHYTAQLRQLYEISGGILKRAETALAADTPDRKADAALMADANATAQDLCLSAIGQWRERSTAAIYRDLFARDYGLAVFDACHSQSLDMFRMLAAQAPASR